MASEDIHKQLADIYFGAEDEARKAREKRRLSEALDKVKDIIVGPPNLEQDIKAGKTQDVKAFSKVMKKIDAKAQAIDDLKWVKVNRTRRTRGYTFEDKIRKKVNEIDNQRLWYCRRLGGSSTGLPDLVITFNQYMGALVAMECKSTKDKYVLEIPADQVWRCVDVLDVFGMYGCKWVCFAFYFAKSEKCKRLKPITSYWLIPRFEPYFDEEQRKHLIKVACDSRTRVLTWFFDNDKPRWWSPVNYLSGYQHDFETLTGYIESEAVQFQRLSGQS